MIYLFAVALFVGFNALSPLNDNLEKSMRVLDDLQKPKQVDQVHNIGSKCDKGSYLIFSM